MHSKNLYEHSFGNATFINLKLNPDIANPLAYFEAFCSAYADLIKSNKNRFQLRPDLLVSYLSQPRYVMDTKWKLLNSLDSQNNFNINQSDIYQMFAYGHKYLKGSGDLVLTYPKHTHFEQPLPCFNLDQDLRLWVVPFCAQDDVLINFPLI